MNEGWKVLWLFSVMFAAAFGAEHTLVGEVVPVGFASAPQPLWAVVTAFVLRALELMTGSVALIALLLMSGVWAHQLREARAAWKGLFRSPGNRHPPSRSIP